MMFWVTRICPRRAYPRSRLHAQRSSSGADVINLGQQQFAEADVTTARSTRPL